MTEPDTRKSCTCSSVPLYDGPQVDCPQHGIDPETVRWLHANGLCVVRTPAEAAEVISAVSAHPEKGEQVMVDPTILTAGILVGISGEDDPVPTQAQVDRAVSLIMRSGRRAAYRILAAIDTPPAELSEGDGIPGGES